MNKLGPKASISLTKREREVLVLVGSGASNMEIAADLNIGYETVITHVQKAIGRLRARNRIEAYSIALRSEMIKISEIPIGKIPRVNREVVPR
jgi:DNA-binding CsgD family transcriptional regulator